VETADAVVPVRNKQAFLSLLKIYLTVKTVKYAFKRLNFLLTNDTVVVSFSRKEKIWI
jgi:hypothetical protein